MEVLEAIAVRNFSAFELHVVICHLQSLPAVGMGRIGKLSALLPVENGALPTCLVVSCCCVLKVSSALSTVCLPVACSADRTTVMGTCGMSPLPCFQDCCLIHCRSSRYRSLPSLCCHVLPICKERSRKALHQKCRDPRKWVLNPRGHDSVLCYVIFCTPVKLGGDRCFGFALI